MAWARVIPAAVLVFRSFLVPLKAAAVRDLLSIGAAYGVLVMVFQWGWGSSPIGPEGEHQSGARPA